MAKFEPDFHAFYVDSGATEAMRIDGSGKVGIGTVSPGRTLDIQTASGDADVRIYANGTGSGDDSILYLSIAGTSATTRVNFGDADDADRGRIIYGHSGDYMSFTTAASEAMRIDSSGNVGIGTLSPTEKLQISGASNSTLLLGYSDGDGVGYRLRSNVTTTVDGGFNIEYNDGTDLYRVDHDGGSGFHAWYMGGTERMRIDSSGVVTVNEGSVVLNGSTISAVQVTVADDAVAALTFTNRRFGMLNVVEGVNDDGSSANSELFLGYVDFGNTPSS